MISYRPGTFRSGYAGTPKLQARDVIAIRAAYKAGETMTAIAKRYRVTHQTISLIVRHKTWQDVEGSQ